MSTLAKVWVTIFVLAIGVYGGYLIWKMQPEPTTPTPLAQQIPGFEVGDFTLTERSGKEFHAKDMQGKIWVASFFFADCPGACVILNNTIAGLLKNELADLPVEFVSITVDPQKDTMSRLREYAGHYMGGKIDPSRWLFLTDPDGKLDHIKDISGNFKLAFAQTVHSDRMILIDQNGVVQGYYQGGFPEDMERMKRKVTELVENPPTPQAKTANQPADAKTPAEASTPVAAPAN